MNLPRSLHAQLDRLQLNLLDAQDTDVDADDAKNLKLQAVIRSFDHPPKLQKLSTILASYEFSPYLEASNDHSEWFILARATTIIVESVLEELFSRTLPLSQDILYWEQLLCSRKWRALYGLQTAPSRIYRAAWATFTLIRPDQNWTVLGTLRNSVLDPSYLRRVAFPHLRNNRAQAASRLLSLDTIVKQEVQSKKRSLIKLRDLQAQAVGLIVAEARFSGINTLSEDVSNLAQILDILHVEINRSVDDDTSEDEKDIRVEKTGSVSPNQVASKLLSVANSLHQEKKSFKRHSTAYGRPSRITRYWPTVVGIYYSGSSVLRYLFNRQAEIQLWAQELLETALGFWQNWIIEPSKKIIATIRHDEGSEVALLGRRSLAADMNSLERMVVEFAADNPQFSGSIDPSVLRASAREGDLTPVLVAYENNIKSPLRSAITGSLIRSLLIQIQKTKVDVEVAINGIDKLLKSQELVFGVLGASPAIIISWGILRSIFRARSGNAQADTGAARLNTVKTLRNIDCLTSTLENHQLLPNKVRGLVICEVQVLRMCATCVRSDLRDQYLQDLDELENSMDRKSMRTVVKRVYRVYNSTFRI